MSRLDNNSNRLTSTTPHRFSPFTSRPTALLLLLLAASPVTLYSQTPSPPTHTHLTGTSLEHSGTSITDTRIEWPGWDKLADTLLMRQYNTRIVLLGTILLGIGAGAVGTFMLLRRRALLGDVIGHSALPGIALAFLCVELIAPGSERSLPVLLLGALLAGLAGVGCTMGISRFSRIKPDAALAIVLSVFFGAGIALFTIIQKLPTGQMAGLQQFIYGQTASMTAADVRLIAGTSLVVVVVLATFFKEFRLLCFDEEFGRSHGWPTTGLDFVLMALVVSMVIIGLQSVGMLLVVAMLIIPAAAARFWTERLGPMTLIAAAFGGTAAWLGGVISSLFARFSAGAVIVLVGSLLFMISLAMGTRRGLVPQLLIQLATSRRVGRHDLARTLYELLEPKLQNDTTAATTADPLCRHLLRHSEILPRRSWSPARLGRLIRRAVSDGLLQTVEHGWRLTESGARNARSVARNHRLWETYLVLHADIATSHVDRDADLIEHVLDPELVEQLQQTLASRYPQMDMPPSLHPLESHT
jgi:manganese/zinc/iron transport system permease protein